ncbi:MAG: plasmid mobilization relaxosome protein MobC [Kordiimonadaceae bacterium]|nr:plasmid mobilization relaxosome protein MobC [Kordiimonadaceae bacterium]
MTDQKPKRPAPLSIRLSPEERARLESDCLGMSLASYIKWRVFDPDKPPPRIRGKVPVKDHMKLGQILALLGASRIASNINQLAKAVHSGSLPVTQETERDLNRGCTDIADMRRMLIEALGLTE